MKVTFLFSAQTTWLELAALIFAAGSSWRILIFGLGIA